MLGHRMGAAKNIPPSVDSFESFFRERNVRLHPRIFIGLTGLSWYTLSIVGLARKFEGVARRAVVARMRAATCVLPTRGRRHSFSDWHKASVNTTHFSKR